MRQPPTMPFALGAALSALAGCSAQRDTTYQGEPLAVLHGTAETSGVVQPPALDAELVWLSGGGDISPNVDLSPPSRLGPVTSPIEFSGQFPSAFTMELMTPPPDDGLIPCRNAFGTNDDEPQSGRFGFAHIQAIRQGSDGGNYFADLFGDASEFRVVYVDQDITACDVLSTFTAPALSKGYHLLRRVAGPCPGFTDSGTPPPATSPESFGQCPSFSEVPITTEIDLPVQADPLQYGPFLGEQPLTAGPNCVQLPTDPTTGSPCQFFLLTNNDTVAPIDCSGPGLTVATPLQCAQLLDDAPQFGDVCEVAQVPPGAWVNGSCAQSAQPGWCYETGSAAAGSCSPQQGAVFFSLSSPPPPGAVGQFLCP